MPPDIDADSTPRPASPPANGSESSDPAVIHPNGNGLRPDDAAVGDPNLTDLVGVLHRRRWWIAGIMAVAALIGYGLGSRLPLESQAETRLLLVEPSEEAAVLPGPQPLPLQERQSLVISRVESQKVRADVTKALRLEPGDIKSVSADAAEGESFVTVTVTTVDGVDTAAITDRVAASVVEQQRAAIQARSEALANELRKTADDTDAEIAAVDAQLEQLSHDIAVLQLQVDRNAGTDASVDPQVALAVKTDMATGLRNNRAALLATQADFESRAKEADVAGAISSGGLEVYTPAGTARHDPSDPADAAQRARGLDCPDRASVRCLLRRLPRRGTAGSPCADRRTRVGRSYGRSRASRGRSRVGGRVGGRGRCCRRRRTKLKSRERTDR